MPRGSTDNPPFKRRQGFAWRVWWLLFVAALAGAGAALPLFLEVFKPLVRQAPPPLPLPLVIIIGVVQNLVLLGLSVGLGLWLARKVHLGAPILESVLYHEKSAVNVRDSLTAGALVGIVLGVVLLVIILLIAPYFPGLPFVTASRVALWKRVLVCFYGGIDEELLARLFLLSLFAWLIQRVFEREKTRLSVVTFWIANIIVAILFGLGHLPSASLIMPITPKVVMLALALNGIAAISFGYLYWKRGLEAAMIAHFCGDFVIYVIGPRFLTIG